MATAFASLWKIGVDVDWDLFGPRGKRRVPLPGYAFQRKRHWIDPPSNTIEPSTLLSAEAVVPTQEYLTKSEPAMTEAVTKTQNDARAPRLNAELLTLLSGLSGEDLGPDDVAVPFLELGFDSLFLGQVSQAVARDYGVDIAFGKLVTEFNTIEVLSQKLDQSMPPEEIAPTPPMMAEPSLDVGRVPQPTAAPLASPVALTPATVPSISGGDPTAVMQMQMQTMQAVFAEQLRYIGGTSHENSAPIQVPEPAPAPMPAPSIATPHKPDTNVSLPLAAAKASTAIKVGRGPNLAGAELNDEQKEFANKLAAKYSEKFPNSKKLTDKYRSVHADPRTVAGFRPEWKEMTFPVVAERSKGARLWDIDGNEFVDLVNGFGQTAFGHSPDFVSKAVKEQLDRGYAIGPQSEIAGAVAERFTKMVGHERVTFCNTGSEAVMSAMRLVRSVTGRDKIIVFDKDYHGQFDEVLIKGKTRGGTPDALPIASGIPRSSLVNMVVLPYGDPAALEWIRQNHTEVAGVIIEPIQSRHPEVQPIEFVRGLREITSEIGAALIFDEVVTGFRVHPRGVQGEWGIKADLATYGKVFGGGMPVGAVAGDARFMDALDGGTWAYGDDSKPETAPTFVAGTFVRHPLVLAAIDASLDHLEKHGKDLWEKAAKNANDLRNSLNRILVSRGLPELVKGHSSWIVPNVTNYDPRATLLYPLMRLEGIHLLDGFCGFLTTEHHEKEISAVIRAFEKSVDTLQSVGILLGDKEALLPQDSKPVVAKQIPLTESQQEIWMTHQQGDMASCCFNEGALIHLEGPLDEEALKAALDKIIARHEGVRLVFDKSGQAFDVLDPYSLPLEITKDEGHGRTVADVARREACTPFELTKKPPFRGHLVKTGPQSNVLILNAHHIICDGWSYNIILEELAQLYRAYAAGSAVVLPKPAEFSEYAIGKQGRPVDQTTKAYWKQQFAETPALPELPTDRQRPVRRTFAGGTETSFILVDTTKKLRKAGAKQSCTLFSTLFAAFQITLGKLSGSTDVVIGVPTGGQSLLENQSLVGHCVNFLPIRAPFQANSSIADHLRSVSGAVMSAFDNQDYTFGQLVKDNEIPRSLQRLPLTEVQFNLEKMPADMDMGAVQMRMHPNAKAATNFDLFMNVIESIDGLRIDVDYNADVYSAETVNRWLGYYEQVLAAMIAQVDQQISNVQIGSSHKAATAVGSNGVAYRDFDRTAMIQSLVDIGGRINPNAIALDDGKTTLTHAELAKTSDALAAYIQNKVPGEGHRIAVALDRSVHMVVTLLAILKAGHAYVPLDPKQPDARLQLIVDTGKVTAMVTDEATQGRFSGTKGITFIDPTLAPVSGVPLVVANNPEATAYIIFTSGTTGTPKGVEIPHRAVVNFLTSMAQKPGLSADDTLLSVTTVMFDIAVLELFLPLTVGAKCVLAQADQIRDGFAIVDRLAQGDISVMQATPTLWEMLIEAGLPQLPGLKILAGGEPLPPDLAQNLLDRECDLWNMYGPTETTIWSAIQKIENADTISIGHPIANTQLVVLDPNGNLAPTGVIGELNIGGDGLASGYFGRPDLTGEAFRSVQVENEATVLYRTGDQARLLSDGTMEVLGRIDTQIKMRGFRIELGEIETKLRANPTIHKAAVDVRKRRSGERQLVAYIVPAQGNVFVQSDVQTSLYKELPDYMVPHLFVELSELPQTANGKLDRKSLPDPDRSAELASIRPVKASSTDTEAVIADIWATVLGVDKVSTNQTLFALGADSLIVFRIAARMIEAGLNLEAPHLFEYPTIEALAKFVDERKPEASAKSLPKLRDFRHGARRKPGATG